MQKRSDRDKMPASHQGRRPMPRDAITLADPALNGPPISLGVYAEKP
ncbi:MAG TPA: hypothetical protein PKH09_05425 [Parvularculaceae bacterium]|nr:hypothetical protein [Parvularculaceae bacterium]